MTHRIEIRVRPYVVHDAGSRETPRWWVLNVVTESQIVSMHRTRQNARREAQYRNKYYPPLDNE